MEAGHGSYLWLPLLCAVITLLLGIGHCSEKFSVCNTRCCTVQPNCSSALQVTCRCGDERLVALRRGDFPESVRSIDVRGARQVIIHENALYDLTSLVTLQLRNIIRLEVRQNGFGLQKNASLFSLDIDNVQNLEINSSAFSGFWEHGTKIMIRSIAWLRVRQNAFSFQSSSHNSSVFIEHVGQLDLVPNALAAPIRFLSVMYVSMKVCYGESFKKNVHHLELRHVKIRDVNEGCVNGTGTLTKLSIASCSLGIIQSYGISGKIQDMRIRDSNITTIQGKGLNLQTASLVITGCRFQSLMSRGLNVVAYDSIYFSKVMIKSLRKHALIGLQVPKRKLANLQSMRMHHLTILQAENGSLAFAKGANPIFSRLEVRSPEPPLCPTEKWIRWLVGKREDGQLTLVEQRVFKQLQRSWLCPYEAYPRKDVRRGANDVDGPDISRGDELSDDSHLPSASVELFVIVCLLLLALLGCVLLHLWLRLRKKGEDSASSTSPEPPHPDVTHIAYASIPVADGLDLGLRKRRFMAVTDRQAKTKALSVEEVLGQYDK